jgi:LPPG:FO 2-phospho-L-lactate transferase
MADACLTAIGVETSASAVAGLYADFLDGWLVDESDIDSVPSVVAAGPRCIAVPLLMRDVEAAAAMARHALRLAAELTP